MKHVKDEMLSAHSTKNFELARLRFKSKHRLLSSIISRSIETGDEESVLEGFRYFKKIVTLEYEHKRGARLFYYVRSARADHGFYGLAQSFIQLVSKTESR